MHEQESPKPAGSRSGYKEANCVAEKPSKATVRRYVPLDVQSWGEAFKIVIGWVLVPCFAILTVVVYYMYEMKYINISDRDLRDMYFDQRINNGANNLNHKAFINGAVCCNPDPVIFKESAYPYDHCMPDVNSVSEDYTYYWDTIQPYCPPLMRIQCPGSLVSTDCNATRAVLYPLLGMDPNTGQYMDCERAGKLRVGAELVATGRPLMIVASWNGSVVGNPVAIEDTFNIDTASVASLVDYLVNTYASKDYVNPNVRLTKAFAIGGSPINLFAPNASDYTGETAPIDAQNGMRTIGPWPFPIFNWPGAFSGRCPNTSNHEQWYLAGSTNMWVPPFTYTNPTAMLTQLTFLTDSMLISPWRLEVVDPGDEAGHVATQQVSLQLITDIQVYVGMVAEAGACIAWMLDESQWGTHVNYQEVYQGPLSNLTDQPYSGNFSTPVNVTVWDVAAPEKPALPFYGGMWYIVTCFAMAALWAFSLGPFLFIGLPLIWWNIRSNRGLPPVVYRYMRKYRGW